MVAAIAAEVEAVPACYAGAMTTGDASTDAETTIEATVDAWCNNEADGTVVQWQLRWKQYHPVH